MAILAGFHGLGRAPCFGVGMLKAGKYVPEDWAFEDGLCGVTALGLAQEKNLAKTALKNAKATKPKSIPKIMLPPLPTRGLQHHRRRCISP